MSLRVGDIYAMTSPVIRADFYVAYQVSPQAHSFHIEYDVVQVFKPSRTSGESTRHDNTHGIIDKACLLRRQINVN